MRATGVERSFGTGENRFLALKGVDFEARCGELLMTVGPSGCGKTTLLSVLCGTLAFDGGEVEVFGRSLNAMTDRQITAFRAADAARADAEATRAALGRSRVGLELLTVRAPREGTILQVNTRPGEFAKQDLAEPLILLGRIDSLQVRADVDEDNAPRVRPGGRAVAFVKGERGDAIPLRFVRVEPCVVPKESLTGESGERVDTRVLQVIFQLDRPPGRNLYVGQQMDVFLDAAPVAAKARAL